MIWLELGLIGFVILAALYVAFARDVVGTIVTFAGLTLAIAVIWVLLAAPDVALIEAAVGAGVTSVLFLIALKRTTGISASGDDDETVSAAETANPTTDGGDVVTDSTETAGDGSGGFHPLNFPAALLVAALAIPLGYTFLSLDPIGETAAVATEYASGDTTPYAFYLENTLEDTGFPNAVVAVLVVYRGLDTLGELIVAFAAAVSILIVLKREDIL
ncbi:DUF4040 domain-containing protein [Natronolimnobius sp. AArcel1]|uniref:hydrogen gas-evolving membrane-bound hydrogenase subunit E n=1 Tax=Natronolimnobius sp. AArcel1 TaxID=1679093 RepID=UPI0013ECF406|nr:hydrogen gas-evolving membrane-bound hydrogenase subunit E [Natronolimnobius sp. AArcel1]NGM71220.1 DUF4040 domain-containing protein [Natronolimnobius sp. AArcel1]